MSGPRPRMSIVFLVAVIALTGCLAMPRAAAAAPSVGQARARAASLGGDVATLNGELAAAAARYDATTQRLAAVDASVVGNRHDLAVARYDLAVARGTLAMRLVALYKSPASGFLDAALTAGSFDDLVSRVRLWSDIYEQAQDAVTQVRASKARVERQGVRLAAQRRRAAALVAQVAGERTELVTEVHRGEALLAAAQSRVQSLVAQAKERARAAAAAAAAARARGATTLPGVAGAYTPESWARALLGYLGAPLSSQNLTAITAWEFAEGGHWFNAARYNPLDTTMPEPGATAMNGVGVKAYTSWAEGFVATVATLRDGLYGPILAALQRGDDALAVATAVAASPWGTEAFGV